MYGIETIEKLNERAARTAVKENDRHRWSKVSAEVGDLSIYAERNRQTGRDQSIIDKRE